MLMIKKYFYPPEKVLFANNIPVKGLDGIFKEVLL